MKKMFYINSFKIMFLILFFQVANSQVGINTTSPTKDLDINGELRIRNLPDANISNSNLLVADVNGNVGKSDFFILSNVVSSVASSNVDRSISSPVTINNIDIGLSSTITIPANKEAFIIVNYSVPIGISSFTQPLSSYYGIRFLKNNIEQESGSRKSTCVYGQNANMLTISNVYVENIPSQASSNTITYSLNGYIEQIIAGSHTYRFNMWSNVIGNNFNWGRGVITVQVYLK